MHIKYLFIVFMYASTLAMERIEYRFEYQDPKFTAGGKPEISESERSNRLNREIINYIDTRISQKQNLNVALNGQPLLHHAVCLDYSGSFASRLLKAGANPDIRNDEKETPLALACEWPSISNMKALLKGGADPNMPLIKGQTAIYYITPDYDYTITANQIIYKILLAFGANPLVTSSETGKTFIEELLDPNNNLNAQGFGNLIKRIYNHKKAAYLLLLRGKNFENSPSFKKLPIELIELILNQAYPGWPLSQKDHSQLLADLQEKALNKHYLI